VSTGDDQARRAAAGTIRRPADQLLPLLSRSRPRASSAGDPIVSRVIPVSKLRAEQGPALAVLKVARDPRGAGELRAQRRVLAEITSHPGLDEDLRELLPRVLAFDERRDATVSVESYRPGIDLAEVLERDPDRVEELTAAALRTIAPLHRSSFEMRRGSSRLQTRIRSATRFKDPLPDGTDAVYHDRPGSRPRLETILARAFVGRRMTVSWTHGDYTPGSVRMAGHRGPVNRIVGWGEARADRLPLIDLYLMILTASCQAQRAALGTVVSDRLRAGGLTDSERITLYAGHARMDTEGGDWVDECLAILLAWLHHTAAFCRQDAGQPERDVALTSSLALVLEAVVAWRGSDASTERIATPAVHQ
jgi:hypothetical protein